MILAGLAALGIGSAFGVSTLADRREKAAEIDFPPLGKILDVNGVPVHAVVQGAGPDLVLIHGAGGNLRDFTFSMVGKLASRYRVIAFDRPGHGYTGRMPGPFKEGRGESPREQARLLQQAARQLGASRPLVLGQSFGGAVAMGWALEDPDMTAGLIVVSGATMPWPDDLKATYKVNASPAGAAVVVPVLTATLTQSFLETILTTIFTPDPVPEGYEAHFGLPLSLRRGTMRANARQIVELKPQVTAMSADYGSITAPIAVLHGDLDTIVPLETHAHALMPLLSNAELTEFPGAGHMPHHSHEAEVIAAIDRTAYRAGLR
ncbi:MAG: alpha/beta hydrolase [Rhodobacteraceae bacterium]|nr:alpha/beta hydrolase [Paracoccaceae bacterium]